MSLSPVIFLISLNCGTVALGDPVDIRYGWERVYLRVPSTTSGDIQIRCSADGTTYYSLQEIGFNTAFNYSTFTVNSSASQRLFHVPLQGIRFVRLVNSETMTVPKTYELHCY